ncbi:uncharacterized protein LOC143281162 [Babylonia areolata]|uniref:uncharacterized protein LOC143281162 n=1 Tax=Babylonia areolata TaxID=304850 RepID=UPI003FD06E15
MSPPCRYHAPSTPSPRTCSLLLVTLLVLSTLLTPCSSLSLMDSIKKSLQQRRRTCENDMQVSAVCFQCASLDPTRFYEIHNPCCEKPGQLRDLCREWYTEEPKRGRRDVWYY